MHDFWYGLTRPSSISVCGALVVTFVLYALLFWSVNPAFMAAHGNEIFANDDRDYDLFVSNRALQLSLAPSREEKLIVLGASTTRAALLETHLEAALARSGHADIGVYVLCTMKQSLQDALALVEQIPSTTRGTLVLGLTPGMFSVSPQYALQNAQSSRMGFRAEIYDDLLLSESSPRRPPTGIYAYDNASFLLGRLKPALTNLLGQDELQPTDSWYAGRPPLSATRYKAHSARVRENLRLFDQYFDSNLRLLEQLVNHVQTHDNLKLVLFDAPVNPAFARDFDMSAIENRYASSLDHFAGDHEICVIRSAELLDLAPGQFYDWAHLNDTNAIRLLGSRFISAVNPPRQGKPVTNTGINPCLNDDRPSYLAHSPRA